MSLRQNLISLLGGTPRQTQQAERYDAPSKQLTPLGYGWNRLGGQTIPPHDTFDNLFPYVTAIANRFSTVVPYAIDGNGNKIEPQPAALQALYRPNSSFSFREFAHYVAQTILTQPYVDILVWTVQDGELTPGGAITPDNIAGYTFLPQGGREYASNRSVFTVHSDIVLPDGTVETRDFTQNEVISLAYSRHPVDPTRTVAPGMTVSKWATVDDFIADYEGGFFSNGAVPAGMLSIVSADATDFARNKARIEETFRGADAANSVLYNMVPIDPATNRPSDVSKVSWTPFQQNNASLDLATLDAVVNRRMANALAVPDIVRGIDNGQTYANAEQAERTFVDNTLHPLLLSVWDKFKFELDRLSGGLGYDITFDLDIPTRTDEEKAKADTENVKASTFLSLVNNGGDPAAVARALGLPPEWGRLGVKAKDTTPTVSVVPSSGSREPTSQGEESRNTPVLPPSGLSNGFSYRVRPTERVSYEKTLKGAKRALRGIVALERGKQLAADNTGDPYGVISTEFQNAIIEAMVPQLKNYAAKTGKTLLQAVKDYAETNHDVKTVLESYGLDVETLYVWDELPDEYRAAYAERVRKVADEFTENGRNAVQEILAEANAQEWTERTLNRALTDFVDGSRAELIAVNELVSAQRLGSLYSARALSTSLHVSMEKIWNTTADDPCPFCSAMNGKSVPLEATFLPVGGVMVVDGKIYANDFVDMRTTSGHPRCRCVATFKVVDN